MIDDNLGIVAPFVAAVRRQNVIILVGGIIVALLLAGIGLAGVTSGRQSAEAARSGAATAAAADRGAAAAKDAGDNAAAAASAAKMAADNAASLLDPAGPTAQAQAVERQRIIAEVTSATDRLAKLIGKNEELSRSLAASETGRRADAASAARQATADRALLTELATRLAAVQATVGRPSPPSTPTTTLPPPSTGLCAALPALAPVLGCR